MHLGDLAKGFGISYTACSHFVVVVQLLSHVMTA